MPENPGNFTAKTPRVAKRTQRRKGREREPNPRIHSISLPPLCELGVLAVKFFDFED
jgi:hypothetical protein